MSAHGCNIEHDTLDEIALQMIELCVHLQACDDPIDMPRDAKH